jgi:hypothetical protein
MPSDEESRALAVELSRQRDEDIRAAVRLEERTDNRLKGLELHAKAVDGQIGRMSDLQGEMNDKLTRVITDMESRAKYGAERDQKKLSKWTIFAYASGFLVGLSMLIVTVLEIALVAHK